MPDRVIRLCEWGRVSVPSLDRSEREEVAARAAEWQRAQGLNAPPLAFEGADGGTMAAKQFVGVVEAAGVTVEIYPKLDKHLLATDAVTPVESRSVLRNLLWMLASCEYEEMADAGDAGLTESAESFTDFFALLLARRLREELTLGVPRRYERFADDLKAVRGRLLIGRQATINLDRYDRIACAFDEFTPDTPLCRVLRCACRTLRARVASPEALRLLDDCLGLLEEVSDVPPAQALRDAETFPLWDRNALRFRRSFALAVRLLRGHSHEMQAGAADTFVFLLDMNKMFESFVGAALRAAFGVPVQEQKIIGRLFPRKRGGIQQQPDFFWNTRNNAAWIGDAKYKRLAAGLSGGIAFDAEEEAAPDRRALSPDDVRQLTVYAEIHRINEGVRPNLALLYPFIGGEQNFSTKSEIAWNGSPSWIVPIRVHRCDSLRDALPPAFLDGIAP